MSSNIPNTRIPAKHFHGPSCFVVLKLCWSYKELSLHDITFIEIPPFVVGAIFW